MYNERTVEDALKHMIMNQLQEFAGEMLTDCEEHVDKARDILCNNDLT